MITVHVKSTSGNISRIHVTGHSNYDESGKDIVCSAVSTAMYLTLGLVEKVCPDYDFKADENNVSMKLEIKESNEFTNLVLENLVNTLECISLDYAKYVKIKYEK
jgi:uncharacterized protein YsxB (DUF464 family)